MEYKHKQTGEIIVVDTNILKFVATDNTERYFFLCQVTLNKNGTRYDLGFRMLIEREQLMNNYELINNGK